MPRPLQIVYCLDNSGIGGTELNAVRTAERLVKEGHSVEVACLGRHPELVERYERAGIPVHLFPVPSLASVAALRQGLRLRSLLSQRAPDVFHAHDIYGNLFGVPWARTARVPVVVASRRWWKEELRPGHRVANRVVSRLADVVLANSPRVAELARGDGGRQTKIAVVPNYVDESALDEPAPEFREEFKGELGIPTNRAVIGCIANLRPVKDHATLLRGVALLSRRGHDVHLVLVGEGECRGELVRLARSLDIRERVSFAGHRPHQPNLHHLFAISVLTSTDEAFSNSLLEAMAAGNPVVATGVGGTPDAVVHGETGLLIPPADPTALADALEEVLTDVNLARRMGEAGRIRVCEMFSPQAALTALTELYERLLRWDQAGNAGRLEEDSEDGTTLTSEVGTP